jgi:hypothetical protein
MVKKVLSLAIVIAMLASATQAAFASGLTGASAGSVTANPTNSTVLVDGVSKTFDSYNINDFNFFKLRDIAFVMNGTEKQFAVDWDAEKNAMTLTPEKAYAPAGDEMASKGSSPKIGVPTSQKVFLAGNVNQVNLEAYNIDGYNYFKLRDVGIVLDIGIGWDNASSTISIDSKKGYVDSQASDDLDKAVAEAIIANNKGNFGGGEFFSQAHITLKTETNGNSTTVYAIALYNEYKKTGTKIENAGGVNSPVAITFKTDSAGKLQVEEYWVPANGNKYQSSIIQKFPKDLHDKTDTQFYIKALQSSTLAQAGTHFK